MSLILSLVRHAPTKMNAEGVFMGLLDPEIISVNHSDLLLAKRRLPTDAYDVVYCSPLKRAIQTCEVFGFGDEVISLDHLKERDVGEWSGLTSEEVFDRYPDAKLKEGKLNAMHTPKNGENINDFLYRVRMFVDLIVREDMDKNIIAFTHYGFIRAFDCVVRNQPAELIFSEKLKNLDNYSYTFRNNVWKRIQF